MVSVVLLFTGVAFAGSAYDSASGISGSSHRAAEEAGKPEDFRELNGPKEQGRYDAGRGFDTNRDSNSGWGNQYIPEPKPKIDKDYSR